MSENAQQVQQEAEAAAEAKEERSLLDQIISDGRLAREESQKDWAKDVVGEFVSQIMEGSMTISKNTEAMINERISAIDKLISDQLNEVMHNENFQKLEASWRGLAYLVDKTETGEYLRIRVMNVSKKELLKDMEKAQAHPNACKDEKGHLRVAAATGVGDEGAARAALSYELAGAIATLSPDLSDTLRADIFLQAGSGLATLNDAVHAKIYLDQAYIVATESNYLQPAYRQSGCSGLPARRGLRCHWSRSRSPRRFRGNHR